MKRVNIIGLPVAATDYAGAVGWILDKALQGDRAHAVEAANTHVAALSRSDEAFGQAMQRFDLILPDGMPLVWALNAELGQHAKLRDRVYGPTLMLRTIEATKDAPQFRHFLLGGRESTLTKLQHRLAQQYPGAIIAGSYSPPFGPWPDDEQARIAQRIRESGANLVWVGLGCPKQEQWIATHKDQLPPAVYFGIGAAFAFHAGEVRQAPSFIQRLGLEWAYRLAMEPRRLFRRYLIYNSLFIGYWLRDRMRGS